MHCLSLFQHSRVIQLLGWISTVVQYQFRVFRIMTLKWRLWRSLRVSASCRLIGLFPYVDGRRIMGRHIWIELISFTIFFNSIRDVLHQHEICWVSIFKWVFTSGLEYFECVHNYLLKEFMLALASHVWTVEETREVDVDGLRQKWRRRMLHGNTYDK